MYRGTPSVRQNRRMNGSYGATANYSTRQFGTNSNRANTHSHYNRFERRQLLPTGPQVPVANATYLHNEGRGRTHSHSLQQRDYATNYSLGDNILDPTPTTSLVARLNSVQEPLTEVPFMKTVDQMPSHLQASFSGETDD